MTPSPEVDFVWYELYVHNFRTVLARSLSLRLGSLEPPRGTLLIHVCFISLHRIDCKLVNLFWGRGQRGRQQELGDGVGDGVSGRVFSCRVGFTEECVCHLTY